MEIFWLDDPDILFKEYNQVLPTREQTSHQQLNALTRLVLIITLVLLVVHFDFWYVFLLASTILIVILSLFILDAKNYGENYSDEDEENKIKKFSKVKTNKMEQEQEEDLTSTTPINVYSKPVQPGTVKVQTKATRIRQNASQDIDKMSERVTRLPQTDFTVQENQTSRVTYHNPRAADGMNAAFEKPRHNGSVGYMSSDTSNLSSERDLHISKEYVVNDYYQRENIRREKLMESYAQKREKDSRYYLEAGGYEPPNMQNKHYFREDVSRPRTHNGYVIL